MKRVLLAATCMLFGLTFIQAQRSVIIYRSCDYQGDSQRLTEGEYLDRDIEIGNDRISAIQIPRGYMVTVFKANNLRGTSKTYYEDVRCLDPEFNDAISSILVERDRGSDKVIVYRGYNYEGDSQELGVGEYRDRDIRVGNDRISSIWVPRGYAIKVYTSGNFKGSSETYYESVRRLPPQFNDDISSMEVFRTTRRRSKRNRN